MQTVVIAFSSLSMCASGGYIFNDLLDVNADRRHPRKRERPFASGDSIDENRRAARGGTTVLLGFGLAALLPAAFNHNRDRLRAATATYSIRLKREPVLDVMVLASLYVIRVIGGGAATGIPVSTWLLAFTIIRLPQPSVSKAVFEVRIVRRRNNKCARSRLSRRRCCMATFCGHDVRLLVGSRPRESTQIVLTLAAFMETSQRPTVALSINPILGDANMGIRSPQLTARRSSSRCKQGPSNVFCCIRLRSYRVVRDLIGLLVRDGSVSAGTERRRSDSRRRAHQCGVTYCGSPKHIPPTRTARQTIARVRRGVREWICKLNFVFFVLLCLLLIAVGAPRFKPAGRFGIRPSFFAGERDLGAMPKNI
jgi:hypothetical protein